MPSNHPSTVSDTSYACPVATDALSDTVLAVAASPVVQAVINSTQAPNPPISLSPPKAKSAKPASNPSYQTRWEREKAKAIQDGVDIEHTGGRRGAGDPQTIGPWILGEMLGKGASGMSFFLVLTAGCARVRRYWTCPGRGGTSSLWSLICSILSTVPRFPSSAVVANPLLFVFLTTPHTFIFFARSRQTRTALPFWQACRRQDT